jgi:large subunit ribosomal protein L9
VEGSQAAKAAEKDVKKKVKERQLEASEMSNLAEQIDGMEITIEAKVGENDKLYGSVTGADIATKISEKIGREIDKKKVDLAEPIRLVGAYDIIVKLMWDVHAKVSVNVISDAPPVVEEKKPRAKKEEAVQEAAVEPAAQMPAIDEAVEDLAEEIEADLEEK